MLNSKRVMFLWHHKPHGKNKFISLTAYCHKFSQASLSYKKVLFYLCFSNSISLYIKGTCALQIRQI